MRKIQYLFLYVLLLVGCSSIGLQKAESFEQQLAYQYGNLTAVYSAAASSTAAGALSVKDAEAILKSADEARVALDTARLAYVAGDITTAEGRLAVAIQLLTVLQQRLHAEAP